MAADDEGPLDQHRPRPELARMLATEHWGLLGTRSMTWSEIMSRISILLTVMSALLVVLALFAQGEGFDRSLLPLAVGFAAASLVSNARWVSAGCGVGAGLLWFGIQLEISRRLFGRPMGDVRFPSED